MRFDMKWAAPVAVAMLASGCTPVDAGFGEAYRYDMAIQTVDPDPVYPADGAKPGDNGEHAAKATERYRKGQTKPIVRERTSSGTGGGGSGGLQ